MKVGIIADDLTGANDTGVQFARKGLSTSVLMTDGNPLQSNPEVLVIDTDSRALSPEEAYVKVKNTSDYFKEINPDILYKKLDSTLRGNVGIELKAVYDSFLPDFVVVAPAYPKNNRVVESGILLIDGKPLHQTEFSIDPKNPVTNSNIVELLENGAGLITGKITREDLDKGQTYVREKIHAFHLEKTSLLVFDSSTDAELSMIVDYVKSLEYKVVWAGSAGLANALAAEMEIQQEQFLMNSHSRPVLMVIGSVNATSREQLDKVIANPSVKAIKLETHLVVGEKEQQEKEVTRVLSEVGAAIEEGYDVVLYSSGNPEEIIQARLTGANFGLSHSLVSECISEVLGKIAGKVVKSYGIDRLFLTGGDTAKKVCTALNVNEFHLIEEMESGIPIGTLIYHNEIIAITKAGGFGSSFTLLQALKVLKGGKLT